MSAVSSLKVSDVNITVKDPELRDLVKDWLPKQKYEHIEFKVTGFASVANAIRRALFSETTLYVMYAELNDIETNDGFTNDWVQNRIQLIPVNQNAPSNVVGSYEVVNNTDDIITVRSSDIKFKPDAPVCDSTYRIAVVTPGKYFKINNIHLVKQNGYEGHSQIASNIMYSGSDNNYFISFDTNGSFNGKDTVKYALNSIIDRFTKIDKELRAFDLKASNEFKTSSIELILNDELSILTIYNESHTVGYLISDYVYKIDPSIPLINHKLIHITERNLIINWRHQTGLKIILDAIEKIIKVFKDSI